MLITTPIAIIKTSLFAIALGWISIFCFPNNVFPQQFERNGEAVTRIGCKVEMSKKIVDSQTVEFAYTKYWSITTTEPRPMKVNGQIIYKDSALSKMPEYIGESSDIKCELLNNIREDLFKLIDGEYLFYLLDAVIDEEGSVVYFEYNGITPLSVNKIDSNLNAVVFEKVCKVLSKNKLYQPAIKDGVPVLSTVYIDRFRVFKVEHNKLFSKIGFDEWEAW